MAILLLLHCKRLHLLSLPQWLFTNPFQLQGREIVLVVLVCVCVCASVKINFEKKSPLTLIFDKNLIILKVAVTGQSSQS